MNLNEPLSQRSDDAVLWQRYEALKREWVDRHPNASAAEYEAAMKQHARSLGL